MQFQVLNADTQQCYKVVIILIVYSTRCSVSFSQLFGSSIIVTQSLELALRHCSMRWEKSVDSLVGESPK